MGPINDTSRRDKQARKLRKRTPDVKQPFDDMDKMIKKSMDQIDVPAERMEKECKELLSILKKDKRLSIRERGFILGLFVNFGNIHQTCQQLKTSWSTHSYWLKTNPAYKEYVDQMQDYILDLIEGVLVKRAIKYEDIVAIKYYLDNKGKGRGFSKEPQITNNITPIQFNINFGGPTDMNLLDGPIGNSMVGGSVPNSIGNSLPSANIEGPIEDNSFEYPEE